MHLVVVHSCVLCLFVSIQYTVTIIFNFQGKLPPLPPTLPRQPPVTADEWERLRDDAGRISSDKEKLLKARVFAGVRKC